jgi:methyl-accepting chemotaxis protein
MVTFSSLPILAKFAVPAALAALIAGAIVFYAAIVIADLSTTAAQLADGDAARVQLALTAESDFNAAAVSEKNAILAAGDTKAVNDAMGKYGQATDTALDAADALARITPDAAQRALIGTFRQAVKDRRQASAHVFTLALAGNAGEAFQYSRHQAAQYRQIAIASITALIHADEAGMKAARDGSIVLASRAKLRLVAGGVLGLSGAFGLLAWIAVMQINRPLTAIAREMMRLANGELDIALPGIAKRDEVGALARSLLVFRENARTAGRLRQEQDAAGAAQALRHQEIEQSIAAFDAQLRTGLDAVNAASAGLQSYSARLAADAGETRHQVDAVSQASNAAASNVQAIAASTEELHLSISEISRQVAQCAGLASEAVTDVSRSTETVGNLAATAGEVGEVIRLIQAVAAKTNLLALNATIEASRAGDAGRGFAVVAGEVKALAAQTAAATTRISAQIAAMQAETASAVHAIATIGGTIGRMSDIATAIASAVEQQNAATKEIAQNINDVASGTAAVTANIASVGTAAGSTGAAADHVDSAARELGAQAARLRGDVDEFFGRIRSA